MTVGTPNHIAADVAEILVNANLTGRDSHGVLRIPPCHRHWRRELQSSNLVGR